MDLSEAKPDGGSGSRHAPVAAVGAATVEFDENEPHIAPNEIPMSNTTPNAASTAEANRVETTTVGAAGDETGEVAALAGEDN